MYASLLLTLLLALAVPGESPKGGRPTVSHVLAWETPGAVDSYTLEQCKNTRKGCAFAAIAVVTGDVKTLEVTGLDKNASYCWRVQPSAHGETYQWSNIVCV